MVVVAAPVVVVVAPVVGVVVDEVAGTEPAAVMTCQVPPKAVIPAPTVELLKPLKNMYSGCPLYVTWKLPLASWTVPSLEAVTPAPATHGWLVSTGGQAMAHWPVQLLPEKA